MSTKVLHVADEPNEAELTQPCSLCGEVLQDYRNVMGPGDWRPAWWAVGGPVTVEGAFKAAYRDEDAVPCVERLLP
jgi:hypothetical protein